MAEADADRLTRLRAFVRGLPKKPGVYRMIDESGQVIYVGKAVNLRSRVSSYFKSGDVSIKTRAMVSHIANIEITVTRSAGEALILENNLIKSLHPRYNVLLRDDKTYPEIELTSSHPFPRLRIHRGRKTQGNRYFGPYADAGRVRETLETIQKMFLLRSCEDSFFSNRSRPCLQYQIKRCKAPCVGLVSQNTYARDVETAVMFLDGRNNAVIDELTKAMDRAATELAFEEAAHIRDQIASLRRLQERQFMTTDPGRECDVIACAMRDGRACVEVFQIRGGRNLGNRSFFPRIPQGLDESDVLGAFVAQHYIGRHCPSELIVTLNRDEADLIAASIRETTGVRVRIRVRPTGDARQWLNIARLNADQNLGRHLSGNQQYKKRLEALRQALALTQQPTRMECFDISHTMGEATVASCVVFDDNGPATAEYRRFNIDGIQPGDDYAAMRQALSRRFRHLTKGEGKRPDILFIDGGKGQCSQAMDVLDELEIDGVIIVGVAKGVERTPGEERLILPQGNESLKLPPDNPGQLLIQHIRDEAHRFAITGHRQRRGKARTVSRLEQVPGIGPGRRRTLLRHFGGLQGVLRAQPEEIASVPGISGALARKIFDALRQS